MFEAGERRLSCRGMERHGSDVSLAAFEVYAVNVSLGTY